MVGLTCCDTVGDGRIEVMYVPYVWKYTEYTFQNN